jgi:methionine synthase I (cobalamin-dependent)
MASGIDKIMKGGVYLSDGAWGTEFFKKGFRAGDPPELLNETHPDWVLDIAQSYVEAGADIILTNTFGGNRVRLSGNGLAQKAEFLNRRGVEISKEAAGAGALVFASIGPTGKMVSAGEITAGEAEEVFREQAAYILKGAPDGIVIETMSDLDEFTAALRAAKSTGLPVAACMSFDSGRDHDRTMAGVPVEAMAGAAQEGGCDLLGANCGVGIDQYIPIAQRLLKASSLPVWIKANAGLPQIENGKTVYKMGPATFAAGVKALADMGVRVVGGCCGTTPAHILASRAILK